MSLFYDQKPIENFHVNLSGIWWSPVDYIGPYMDLSTVLWRSSLIIGCGCGRVRSPGQFFRFHENNKMRQKNHRLVTLR